MLSGIIGHRTGPHDIYRLPSISHWIFNQLGRAGAKGRKTKYHHNKEYSGEKLRGEKMKRWGMKKKGEFTIEREREKTSCVCVCVFLNLILWHNSASPLCSLAKRRPNEQGQTQLTPSVSDRYDCVCVCVSRPISRFVQQSDGYVSECNGRASRTEHVLQWRRRRAFHLRTL